MVSEAALLHCPIRGALKVKQRAADALTFTEEKQRIDGIRYLLQRKYPPENFGIETTLFSIGHQGKNSFRTDFAVYDSPFDDVRGKSLEKRLDHLRLLAEIKRDNQDATRAKATQVVSALRLVPGLDTLGVYWDDVEQRFFFKKLEGKRESIIEAPISKIPTWGAAVGSIQLMYPDLVTATNLIGVFDGLENVLHPHIVDKVERYALIQQLLLTKIHDENLHHFKPTTPLAVQDFSAAAVVDSIVLARMNAALARAATHYHQYLPKRINKRFRCNAEALRNATKILAPLNILGSKRHVIQAFYMKFAKSLYKWDLAQYFTPHEAIDFIVNVVHPRYGEHVKDPACGSADFLISAFRHADNAAQAKDCVWGSDNSPQAVQISVLNMVLNGDGKSQIVEEDSLETYTARSKRFQVVLCNPPFGTKILEKRPEVLSRFSMGHEWKLDDDGLLVETERIRKRQQTGILFTELCVGLAESGGRVGIILPNGYLGNKGADYLALREWLLCHTRVVGVVAFPRFTFKKSGADVSASAVFLEKRDTPLARATESEGYQLYVGLIESVGWRAGDKKAVPIYLQDQETGQLMLDESNEPILDSDFANVLDEFLRSPAAHSFPWLLEDREIAFGPQTWSVAIDNIVESKHLSLDPKRLSYKFQSIRTQVKKLKHIMLGDVVDVIQSPRFRPEASRLYQYVEIQHVGAGDYDYETLRGWQLPDRARLQAEPNDIFISHLWSCAGKWFIATGDCSDLVVTNGCTRLRLKRGLEEMYWPDIAAGFCLEVFRVQIRALATGSDGLAEISNDDLLSIVLPCLGSTTARSRVLEQLMFLMDRDTRFGKAVQRVTKELRTYPTITLRKSHCSVV